MLSGIIFFVKSFEGRNYLHSQSYWLLSLSLDPSSVAQVRAEITPFSTLFLVCSGSFLAGMAFRGVNHFEEYPYRMLITGHQNFGSVERGWEVQRGFQQLISCCSLTQPRCKCGSD